MRSNGDNPPDGTIVVRGTPQPGADGAVALPCDSHGQAISALHSLVDAVAREGATIHDIVSTSISVSDPAAWATVSRAHAAFFRGIDPAATMVEAPYLDAGTVVEIEARAIAGKTPPKSACERCGAGLADDSGAANCGWNCTFCEACARQLDHRCPNCGGALVVRRR
jgi:uncharacterized protein